MENASVQDSVTVVVPKLLRSVSLHVPILIAVYCRLEAAGMVTLNSMSPVVALTDVLASEAPELRLDRLGVEQGLMIEHTPESR